MQSLMKVIAHDGALSKCRFSLSLSFLLLHLGKSLDWQSLPCLPSSQLWLNITPFISFLPCHTRRYEIEEIAHETGFPIHNASSRATPNTYFVNRDQRERWITILVSADVLRTPSSCCSRRRVQPLEHVISKVLSLIVSP
jgi:hypothetical protein